MCNVNGFTVGVVDDLVPRVGLVVTADELEVERSARFPSSRLVGSSGDHFGDLLVALDRVDADGASRAADGRVST